MASKRINVLIYSGPGTSLNAVRHATWSLRRLLGSWYAVLTVTGDQILKEPWTASCALLVMPGGADLGYCRVLNGEGNQRIKQFVQLGGAYMGFCAGGYYGSSRCEFEVGKRAMEVIGDRELALFPGICRGLAFSGFVYQSEAGARAVSVKPNDAALVNSAAALETFRSYYNGGGAFVDADKLEAQGVEVLATYNEDIEVDTGKVKAAVVYRKIGEGAAIVTGPHPEFSGANLDRDQPSNPKYGDIVDALIADEGPRTAFMKACLAKLGLEVSQNTEAVPSLSRLHLSAVQPAQVTDLVVSLREAGVLVTKNGSEYIEGENDTFRLESANTWSVGDMAQAVSEILPQPIKSAASSATAAIASAMPSSSSQPGDQAQADTAPDRVPDYSAITKHLVAHETSLPDPKSTPHFNHAAYFANLKHFQSQQPAGLQGDFGRTLLYGEVVTSTNTLLEKNPALLACLPIGFTATATTQVAGRGRGANVWVSPRGSLMFSTVLRHSLQLNNAAPVVFVQYLAALAVVDAIKAYGPGYAQLPVKLKWPNDIYALHPTTASHPPGTAQNQQQQQQQYVKVGGVLVTSSYAGGDYTLVVGIGLNASNAAPTTSLSQLARAAGLAPFALEKLLAAVLVHFEAAYARFCRVGFDTVFERAYYAAWLHSGQVVTLEAAGGVRARITGITRDWGLLVAEELDDGGSTGRERATGRRWQLQSDSNSFDFFKGLLKRKL